MKTLREYAIEYAKHGLHVIPCINKKPICKFANKPAPSPEEVSILWMKNPQADIAVKTEKFLVVDVDCNHDNGINGLTVFQALPKEWFPETLTQTTKHGGKQLFYLKPENEKLTQVIGWKPGIDIKANNNNYVMMAPSNGYKWDNEHPIVKATPGLLNSIKQKQPSTTNANFNLQPGTRTKTTELFETIWNGFGEPGKRNDTLTSFVGGLLIRGVTAKAAYGLANIANENTAKPIGEAELNNTFNSVMRKEALRREQS